MNKKRKVIIFTVVILLLAVIGAFIIQKNTGFRVISRDPGGDVPLSVTQISFTLSEKITNKDTVKFSIKPAVAGSFAIHNAVVIFSPDEPFKDNQSYTFSIQNANIPRDTKVHSAADTFIATYVPYDKLSAAEKARQMQRTNPIQQQYPVTRDLPYVTASYKMEYTPPSNKSDPIIIRITPLISQSRGESLEQYHDRLLKIRDDADAYLNSKGYDKSTYLTYYQDIFLLQYSTAASQLSD